ncbi:MAG TPA: methyltransferase domain-containing protein, partial [Burkholderiales bacterium]|nr:methyltransferase domain-containing protein [Burkholderiales bacterium]
MRILLAVATAMLVAVPSFAQQPDVIYVPTPHDVVEDMLRLANVGKGDVLYDLGSGDGRIAIAAAKKYGIRAVGIDIDPERIKEATANAK